MDVPGTENLTGPGQSWAYLTHVGAEQHLAEALAFWVGAVQLPRDIYSLSDALPTASTGCLEEPLSPGLQWGHLAFPTSLASSAGLDMPKPQTSIQEHQMPSRLCSVM